MASIITVQAWRVLPFAVVIFLAGHASIPQEVEDAAKVDGATGIRKLDLRHAAAAVADRARRGPLRDRSSPRPTWRSSTSSRTAGRSTRRRSSRRGRSRQGIQGGSLGEGAAVSLFLLPVLAVVAITMLFFARRAEVA